MEYLPSLQMRHKWYVGDRNLIVGVVVLVVKENTSRYKWPLGKVIKALPGSDGKVREMVVETSSAKL